MDYAEFNAESLLLDESFQRFCLGTDERANEYWKNWLNENPDKRVEFFRAKELYLILNGNNHEQNFEKDKSDFLERLQKEGLLKNNHTSSQVVNLFPKYNRVKNVPFFRLLAAAAIFGVVVLGGFLLLVDNKNAPEVAERGKGNINKIERAPGKDLATLTLADGRTILLDSTASGMITQQGKVNVINRGGVLTYENVEAGTEVVYNTITTPKSGQYQLMLADGSKVWLNASSSLRFPSAFIEGDRSVELRGEGYFEIAHNASMPFHVKVGGMKVEVLGTQFNIMAYSDEESVKTTLLEGKVKVQKDRAFTILNPGQQAQVSLEGSIRIDKNADVEEAVAWKNGLFQFSGADMRTVMRHIGRWYDIETELSGDMKNIHISGKVSRNLNLSQVIQVLEDSGIDIQQEGNKLIASPKL